MIQINFFEIFLGIGLEIVAQGDNAFDLCIDRIGKDSEAYGLVERGDILISIADRSVELEAADDFGETSFHKIIQDIMARDRPLALGFERSKSSHNRAVLEATESTQRSARCLSSFVTNIPTAPEKKVVNIVSPGPIFVSSSESDDKKNSDKLSLIEEVAISQALDAYTDAAAELNAAQVACRDEDFGNDEDLRICDSKLKECESRILRLQASIEELEKIKFQARLASVEKQHAEIKARSICRFHAKLLLRESTPLSPKTESRLWRTAAASITRKLTASSSRLDLTYFLRQSFDLDDSSDSDASEEDYDLRDFSEFDATQDVTMAISVFENASRKERSLLNRIESLSNSFMPKLLEIQYLEDERRRLNDQRRVLLDSKLARKVVQGTLRFLANSKLSQLEELARTMEQYKKKTTSPLCDESAQTPSPADTFNEPPSLSSIPPSFVTPLSTATFT
eukprot:CAMPEP_0197318192 /NCGR_PEP_ID=MMETSP0891-20130614/49860_1 /TAXON_ID=44058 ORGANISM="Aureoumbra lagunensis, Strain CCMP1510" /NCGR_SAMPLE_ID=MMETSP0891 /ASSEMBLY_ACC=CAM_ASM_000534 /LENGTH=453 /DNA_ID=CAMNT_0042808517 /DNA_START=95 /DNA_END=1456 /DNA_ORIENTATION=-